MLGGRLLRVLRELWLGGQFGWLDGIITCVNVGKVCMNNVGLLYVILYISGAGKGISDIPGCRRWERAALLRWKFGRDIGTMRESKTWCNI